MNLRHPMRVMETAISKRLGWPLSTANPSRSFRLRHSSSVSASVGHRSTTHLDEVLEEMMHQGEQKMHKKSTHQSFHKGAASAAHHVHTTTRNVPHARLGKRQAKPASSPTPTRLDDPASTLQALRDLLQEKGSALLVVDEQGTSLLDAVTVLHLLSEDLQAEDPASVVIFQPMNAREGVHVLLVMRVKAASLLHHQLACDTSRPPLPGITVPELPIAVANQLAEFGCSQLECDGSSTGLVLAFRALELTRRLVKMEPLCDIIIMPRVVCSGQGCVVSNDDASAVLYFDIFRKRMHSKA